MQFFHSLLLLCSVLLTSAVKYDAAKCEGKSLKSRYIIDDPTIKDHQICVWKPITIA